MIALFQRLGLLSLVLALWAMPASACTVASPPTSDLGSYSPGAIKDLAVTRVGKSGGIDCSGTVLSVLGGNVLTATISNTNSFKLTSANKPDGAFQVYPSATSQTVFAENVAVNFLNPQVIDLLGLLGNSPSSIPLYIKPTSTTALMPGVYQGAFRVTWAWKFCSGVWVGNSCTLGTRTEGTQSANIAFTVTVAPKPLTVAISSITTWDPVTQTTNPKAIVGAKQRITIVVTNPDIIPADPNTVRIELPVQAGTAVALEGDGASSGSAIRFADGATASNLAFSYVGPGDMSDDVDFFSAGVGWAYVPTPGDAASQSMVTKIRLKPRGTFAPRSSFSVTLPYVIK
ncbi:protein CsuE [Sphingomonas sp. IC-56]|uniref:spore coat protein U domain-containing protein n=1 Tax=Sphingomonas sp. IC-56 TaxID=2898529 RepID=UPI001E4D87FE|nr:protein CsuE [Sphingomonas sp. IC-56]MCD2324388.1 protein CsuE [Sphingomonas sp. IC-56]